MQYETITIGVPTQYQSGIWRKHHNKPIKITASYSIYRKPNGVEEIENYSLQALTVQHQHIIWVAGLYEYILEQCKQHAKDPHKGIEHANVPDEIPY